MVCYTCKAHEDSQSEDDLKGVAWHVYGGWLFEGEGCVVVLPFSKRIFETWDVEDILCCNLTHQNI